MSDWIETSLERVVELRRGFDLPSGARRAGPYPVLSAGRVAGWHDEGPVRGPGLTIGRATNLGQPTWSQGDFWPLNTTLYVSNFNENVPRWIFYLFESIDLRGYDSGSVQPMLNRNYISKVRVRVPPKVEQEAITEVLGALDDKIAANVELVGTSSKVAELEFERALRQLGVEVELDAVSTLVSRGITPAYTEDSHAMIVLNQKCVRDRRVNLKHARRTSLVRVRGGKILEPGDVLVNSTGYGTLGRVARWTGSDSVTVDSHITIVRFDPAKVDRTCGGFALLRLEAQIEAMGEGSTGQTELSRIELGKLRLRIPHPEAQLSLGSKLDALTQHADARTTENARLAELRDTLLPQLMSGRLRVKDAEKRVGAVV